MLSSGLAWACASVQAAGCPQLSLYTQEQKQTDIATILFTVDGTHHGPII
jgi:hypothetical protein